MPPVYLESFSFSFLCNIEYTHTVLPNFHIVTHHFLHFRVVFSVHCSRHWVIACRDPSIGSSKLLDNIFFAKSLATGSGLTPANNLSTKEKTGDHSHTMAYERKYVDCHTAKIGILWVCFLLLVAAVGYVRYLKYTAHLQSVRVVIIDIWINLPPVL
jgi:hypothetical protein